MMTVATMSVVSAIAMAVQLGLKNQSYPLFAIVVVMRHNSMEHDNRTCCQNTYFSRQMLHIVHIV